MPYSVEKNLNDEEMDEEGRIITAEYSKFYLVCVYVPNAGRKLVNLDRRLRWNKLFENHVTTLKAQKPVVICGDMNVAHEEIGEFKIPIRFQRVSIRIAINDSNFNSQIWPIQKPTSKTLDFLHRYDILIIGKLNSTTFVQQMDNVMRLFTAIFYH